MEAPNHVTFVAQWAIPRAPWPDFQAAFDKNTRPTLEKRMAGTLLGWGFFAEAVHDESGMTHGICWQPSSIAGLMHAEETLQKSTAGSAPPPGMASAKHLDALLHSISHTEKPGYPARAISGWPSIT